MDPALRDATLGAANIQTPTSPLGSFPELAAAKQTSFQLPQATQAAGAGVNQAQTTVAAQRAAASALADKSKYQKVPAPDGGFKFYDPTGKEMTAEQYAQVQGTTPQKVLEGSTNPIDIGYLKDYQFLQDYTNLKLKARTDSTAADQVKNIESQINNDYGIDVHNNFADVLKGMRSAYPTIYGSDNGFNGPGSAGVPSGQTFIPDTSSGFDTGSSSSGVH